MFAAVLGGLHDRPVFKNTYRTCPVQNYGHAGSNRGRATALDLPALLNRNGLRLKDGTATCRTCHARVFEGVAKSQFSPQGTCFQKWKACPDTLLNGCTPSNTLAWCLVQTFGRARTHLGRAAGRDLVRSSP